MRVGSRRIRGIPIINRRPRCRGTGEVSEKDRWWPTRDSVGGPFRPDSTGRDLMLRSFDWDRLRDRREIFAPPCLCPLVPGALGVDFRRRDPSKTRAKQRDREPDRGKRIMYLRVIRIPRNRLRYPCGTGEFFISPGRNRRLASGQNEGKKES